MPVSAPAHLGISNKQVRCVLWRDQEPWSMLSWAYTVWFSKCCFISTPTVWVNRLQCKAKVHDREAMTWVLTLHGPPDPVPTGANMDDMFQTVAPEWRLATTDMVIVTINTANMVAATHLKTCQVFCTHRQHCGTESYKAASCGTAAGEDLENHRTFPLQRHRKSCPWAEVETSGATSPKVEDRCGYKME